MKLVSEKTKVLVVDDEPDMLIFLSRLLETGGFKPIVAGGEAEGLAKIQQESPALIILDLMITPDGRIQLYPLLKQDDRLKDVPVILLSEIDEKTFAHYRKMMAPRTGMGLSRPEAFLEKPPEAEELLSLAWSLVRRGRGGGPFQTAHRAVGPAPAKDTEDG
ncbi:MAG: response regulator [Thermodesulfobacteriota bacterium]